MTAPQIFDRAARRLSRDRSAHAASYLVGRIVEDLLERLDGVNRRFETVLIVGAEPALIAGLAARGYATVVCDPSFHRAGVAGGIQADEDRLPVGDTAFDLVMSAGCLDTVADLPGALLLCRRALRPDGLFLAGFAGAPSLPSLRRAVAIADGDNAVARFHPQIDVRAAGDLLVRAGFALPVADLDTLTLRYGDVGSLIGDLREAAATNCLANRYPVSHAWLARLTAAFAGLADDDGRTRETLSVITLTGWAPAPGQPKPATRGSGNFSLAAALRPRG